MTARKVYLAGPGVFRPNAKQIGEELKALCQRHGLEGLWPLDNEPPRAPCETPLARARSIYRGNLSMVRDCEAVVADISPFRGPHMDVGTAFEIGVAVAQGKPVFAWSSRPLPLSKRVVWSRDDSGRLRDRNRDLVEDFGLVENLMIAHAVRPQIADTAELAISRCAGFLLRSAA